MSYGLMCLTCRLYINPADKESGCKCAAPVPSEDGKTPVSYVNYVPASRGRVAALCCCCGRRSRPTKPDADGEPVLWEMGRDWSEAPYPHHFKHDDGSIGSTWTCPPCNKRLRAGETLRLRNYDASNRRYDGTEKR